MSEYTPTTEDVRATFAYIQGDLDVDEGYPRFDQVHADALDRWLAQVRAEAWDEGHDAGYEDAQGYYALGDGCGPYAHDCTCPNPYSTKED